MLMVDTNRGNTSAFGWQYLHQGGRFETITGHRPRLPRWIQRPPERAGVLHDELRWPRTQGHQGHITGTGALDCTCHCYLSTGYQVIEERRQRVHGIPDEEAVTVKEAIEKSASSSSK
jgi:hypothetical protein